MQKYRAPLNLHHVLRLATVRPCLLRNDLDFDAIDTTNQLRLVNRLALLLAALIARSWAATVDASSDRNAIHLKSFVTIDGDEQTIYTVRQGDRNLWHNLKVGMSRRNDDCSTVCGLLLVGINIDRPWLSKVKCRMCVQGDLRQESLIDAYKFVSKI